MKKLALLTLLALSLAACTEKIEPNSPKPPVVEGEKGILRIALAPEGDITVVENKANESANVNNFEVDIQDASGVSFAKYASYAQVPAEVALPAGKYSIVASSGRLKSSAFDEPHFAGVKAFEVEVGKTAEVNVACVITNVKVTIEYTEKILATLTDIQVRVTSTYDANDNIGRLTFTPDEKRAGWFAKPIDKKIEVYVTGKNKQNGSSVNTSTTLSGVEARQWRKMTLDIKTSGGVDVEITVDETLIEAPATDVTIPDSDDVIDNNGDNGNWDEDPTNPPVPPVDGKPTIVGAALGTELVNVPFDVTKEVNFKVETDNVLDVLMTSQAAAGISNLFLTIESDALVEVLEPILGITGEIDLANPIEGAKWVEMFTDPSIALIDLAKPIKGKTQHTFSVGKLMALLGSLPGGKDAPHKFHLRLVDANGEVAKTLTIVLQ